MKFLVISFLLLLLWSPETIIGQTKIELLSNRDLLSNLYRAETKVDTQQILCATNAYQIRYYDKLNSNLKFIIKYDCNDVITHSSYSCNVLSNTAVFEYVYDQDSRLKIFIQYDQDLKMISYEEFEKRRKSFNEKEERTSYLYPEHEDYIIQKIILADSKPFKSLLIDKDGKLNYISHRKRKNKNRRYK